MYTGLERRKVSYCQNHDALMDDIKEVKARLDDINELKTDVAVIKNTIQNAIKGVTDHIEHGVVWRRTIYITSVGLFLAIASGIFGYGQLSSKVSENYRDIEKILSKLERIVEKTGG